MVDHSMEEFLRLFELVQVARACRGETPHKPDAVCFEQAVKIDTARAVNGPQCHSEGHDRAMCFDCQQVTPLVQSLVAKLQAAGIVLPPGGKKCKTKLVWVHWNCYMDMNP